MGEKEEKPKNASDILGRFFSGLQILARESLDQLAELETTSEVSEQPFLSLSYEGGQGARGPYEIAKKSANANPNFTHCWGILQQNVGHFAERGWLHYYWAGTDAIFRRKKKS